MSLVTFPQDVSPDGARSRGLYARVQVQTENFVLVIERGHKARAYVPVNTRFENS